MRFTSGNQQSKKYIIETNGTGVAFLDYDRDGRQDVFLVNGSRLEGFPQDTAPTNHLYHNEGSGRFRDVTTESGAGRSGWGNGVCVGDVNPDLPEGRFGASTVRVADHPPGTQDSSRGAILVAHAPSPPRCETRSMMRVGLWAFVTALLLFPVAYFGVSWPDYTFRIGAMGNWFGTVVGVVVGVPIGVQLARAQQLAQAESERKREDHKRQEYLRSVKHRVYAELEQNLTLVKHLNEVLGKSPKARADVWKWSLEIMGQVENEAFRELHAMLIPEERASFAAISLAHANMKRLVGRIRESSVAHDFLYGYSADEVTANWRLSKASNSSSITVIVA
jgi:hypothetical protein